MLLLLHCKGCSKPAEGETPAQAAERRVLAVSSLQALALDYDLGDHEILKESIMLEVMLFYSMSAQATRSSELCCEVGSWCLFEEG